MGPDRVGEGGRFRALLRAFLVLDLHNPSFARATASRPGERIPPLFWVVGQHLLLGLATSFVLYARVSAGFFALCHLVLGMLAIISAVVVELHEVVGDPEDGRILGPLPVHPRTIALARLANLGCYLAVITLSLHLVPAIVGCGLRDAGWRWLPAYAAAALLTSLVAAGAAVLLLALVPPGRVGERLRDLLAWTQILLILAVGYGGQALLRDAGHRLAVFAADLPAWVWSTPPGLGARFTADACADAIVPAWWIPGAALGAILLLWLPAWLLLSRRGTAGGVPVTAAPLPALTRPGRLGGRLARLCCREGWGRLGFWFAQTQLARDAQVRLRALPGLSMPLAPLALGAFWHRLGDPLHRGEDGILAVAAVYLMALPMPAVVAAMQGSRDPEAAWILASAPLAGRDRLLRGTLRAATALVALPMALAVALALAWAWRDPLDALLLAAAGAATAHLAGAIAMRLLGRHLPGSRPFVRGGALGTAAVAGAAMAVLAGGLAAFQTALVHDRAGMALLLAVLVLAALVGERLCLPLRRDRP